MGPAHLNQNGNKLLFLQPPFPNGTSAGFLRLASLLCKRAESRFPSGVSSVLDTSLSTA